MQSSSTLCILDLVAGEMCWPDITLHPLLCLIYIIWIYKLIQFSISKALSMSCFSQNGFLRHFVLLSSFLPCFSFEDDFKYLKKERAHFQHIPCANHKGGHF